MLRAVLLDVGGTLWPDQVSPRSGADPCLERAIFEAAIREAGCSAAECVMVGNSETNDIQPAIELGMLAIRVAIEEPAPASSAAHAVVTSLEAVAELIAQWCDAR